MSHGPAPGPDAPIALHACAVVVEEAGILVRGPSRSGKTRLALALVDDARLRGGFARLVADDRTLVARHGDRLVARPHPALAGRVERRGFGIVPVEHEPACVLALAVDLVEGWPERLPGPEALSCRVAGVALPRIAVASGAPTADAASLVRAALTTLRPAP